MNIIIIFIVLIIKFEYYIQWKYITYIYKLNLTKFLRKNKWVANRKYIIKHPIYFMIYFYSNGKNTQNIFCDY